MSTLALYWHTVRHLRPVQVYGRVWFRLRRPTPDLSPPPARRPVVAPLIETAWREPSMLGPDTVAFLGRTATVKRPEDWTAAGADHLWLYNLHYFDDLGARDAPMRADWHRALVARWIAENPPGSRPGWEPYPTSLRLVNWIRWILAGNVPSDPMVQSIAVQARWLAQRLETHLLGNHLLANAKALTLAGLFFDGDEARGWYRIGTDILARELDEQILADGGHFELSPMYHHIVLADVLDLLDVHACYAVEAPPAWRAGVARMLAWSAVMRHPDGDIPFFNDAAFGIAPTHAILAQRAAGLGIAWTDPGIGAVARLPESGYVRLRRGEATVFADLAPIGPDYLPAHAHADTLSFELSLRGRRVVVNGGTSRYGTGPERQRQRSTAAHATLALDGADSSEVWGGFRVGRRARVSGVEVHEAADALVATGCHDGYARLPGSPLHRRTWRLDAQALTLDDEVRGSGRHEARIVFPLGPGLAAQVADARTVRVVDTTTGETIATFAFEHDGAALVEDTTWHPAFGQAVPSQRIVCRLPVDGTAAHRTTIAWGER
ncbi:hypothetical protein CCR97_16220 [Rhodoplanes elegans]|uniref:Uncharacterized protein n=1 Tax=Rhodoplanes elegans TaxID=29408 RepID=A0A327KPZ9_9BRAD|nr:heparinase II/III family protein [Rhodoplanes elegans]MBK5959736.1 hypothetical protein [Rhodoplanes elegans]RAI39412.1 hypothetical protein CH338_09500 [Rhodoplanes elegans]